jgi:hypothetical protein
LEEQEEETVVPAVQDQQVLLLDLEVERQDLQVQLTQVVVEDQDHL